MQTIAIDAYGAATAFHSLELPQLLPQANEVLIQVHAFSVNPMDVAGRQGRLGAPFDRQWSFPLVLGWDFAGTVIAPGQNVSDFHPGDRVFGSLAQSHAATNGTYSEYVVAGTRELAHLPADLTFIQGAALPVSGVAAYQALTRNLKVQVGETVLIQGGAGGVGLLAVQIARALGAHVITTASAQHAQRLLQAGAEQVLDYHQQLSATEVPAVDAVLDTVGAVSAGLKLLKPMGRLVTLVPPTTSQPATATQPAVSFQATDGTTADLDALAQLVQSGQLSPYVTTLPFSAASVIQAHQQLETHHTTGKLVIQVKA